MFTDDNVFIIMRLFIIVSIFFACITSTNIQAETTDWKSARDDGDIRVFQRNMKGYRYKETYGQVQIKTTLAALVSLLNDVMAFKEWMHKCKYAITKDKINLFERTDYMVIESPIFITNRDVYIHSLVEYEQGAKQVTIKINSDESFLKNKNNVRIRDLKGYWRFREVAPGYVDVHYQIISDPNILFKYGANQNMVKTVYSTLEKMKAMVVQNKYRQSTILDSIPNGS